MEIDREMTKGTTVPIVLQLLAEREMYGYEMIKVVNERTDGLFDWREGTLYPCLHGLESAGLLSSRWRETPGGRKRKYYRVTAKGRAELRRKKEQWKRFAHGVNLLLMGARA